MIEFREVSFRFPNAERDILHHINANFEPGRLTAVTGKNGCGKTTMVRLMTGCLRPSEGAILIDGEDIAGLNLFSIGQKIGCVFQNPSRQLFCPTVYEEIAFALKNRGAEEEEIARKWNELAPLFRLESLRDRYPGSLSRGEQQRVMLAAVLAMDTAYVLLDEPTTGLDMRARQQLGETLTEIKQSGRGVIMVTHERAFLAQYADREWRLQ